MKWTIPALLFLTVSLPAGEGFGQTGQEGDHVTVFREVYRAIRADLPPGPRAVVLDDHKSRSQLLQPLAADVAAGRDFALTADLRSGLLSEVLSCRESWDCTFVDGITATVSFRVASRDADSVLVESTTRYFKEYPNFRRRFDAAWQVITFYEVLLVPQGRGWRVERVRVTGHS